MKRRGSVLMEFVVVAPLLLLLVSLILQFAQVWVAREVTAYAAYCACRAALSAGSGDGEAANGAQKAAELACAWMCLAGLPGTTQASSGGTSETVSLSKFHDLDVDESATVTFDDGSGVSGEIVIPGWGSIPGSNSARARVAVTDLELGPPFVRATVMFRFPLMLPLAGSLLAGWSDGWGVDGNYPQITLTETAVLPMTARLALAGAAYATDLPTIGGGAP